MVKAKFNKMKRKNTRTKAEHIVLGGARSSHNLNELMIKLENKYGLRKPNTIK
jgi:hypothetical protein